MIAARWRLGAPDEPARWETLKEGGRCWSEGNACGEIRGCTVRYSRSTIPRATPVDPISPVRIGLVGPHPWTVLHNTTPPHDVGPARRTPQATAAAARRRHGGGPAAACVWWPLTRRRACPILGLPSRADAPGAWLPPAREPAGRQPGRQPRQPVSPLAARPGRGRSGPSASWPARPPPARRPVTGPPPLEWTPRGNGRPPAANPFPSPPGRYTQAASGSQRGPTLRCHQPTAAAPCPPPLRPGGMQGTFPSPATPWPVVVAAGREGEGGSPAVGQQRWAATAG